MRKIVIATITLCAVAGAGVAYAQSCPEGYRRDCRTDSCAERRTVDRCVRWENNVCVDSRQETVCVPRTICTCERG